MTTRDEYVETIKSAAVSLSSTSAYAALVAEFPFLALPVISTVLKELLSFGIGWLADKTELGLFFTYIDFRVSQQGRDFFDAAVARDKPGTPEEQAAREKAFEKAFRTLVVLTS